MTPPQRVCRGPPLWDMAPAQALVGPGLSLEDKQTSCSQEATWGQAPLHRGGHITQQFLQEWRGAAIPGPGLPVSDHKPHRECWAGLRLKWAPRVGDWEQQAQLLPPPLTPFCPVDHTHLGGPELLTHLSLRPPRPAFLLCSRVQRPWALSTLPVSSISNSEKRS